LILKEKRFYGESLKSESVGSVVSSVWFCPRVFSNSHLQIRRGQTP